MTTQALRGPFLAANARLFFLARGLALPLVIAFLLFGREEKVGAVELSFFVRWQGISAADALRTAVQAASVQCSAPRLDLQGPAAPAKLRLIELKAFSN